MGSTQKQLSGHDNVFGAFQAKLKVTCTSKHTSYGGKTVVKQPDTVILYYDQTPLYSYMGAADPS